MNDKTLSRKNLEAVIVRRAMIDPTFREALFTDARAAVNSVLADERADITLPEGFEVKAIQEPTNTFYVVVPTMPGQLDEAALETVAGGSVKIHIGGSIEWD